MIELLQLLRGPKSTRKKDLWVASHSALTCFFPQSLTGHKNPVECVQFNSSEEQVVTGSQSGSIRVWDLEAAKSKNEALFYGTTLICFK